MESQSEAPRWRGVHHLALVAVDMDTTVRFYEGVLGARVVATVATEAFRHYFFEFGPGSTVAFFEYSGIDVEAFSKPAGVPYPQAAQFDHLALALADEEALVALRDRLKAADCEVTDVVDQGFLRSIYFTDPNGIALEASCWMADPTGRSRDFTDAQLFADPNPVSALVELRQTGRVATTPATRLAAEITRDIYGAGAR
ncbi:MAG: VOC family protein [Acidimicrobiia bacterium]